MARGQNSNGCLRFFAHYRPPKLRPLVLICRLWENLTLRTLISLAITLDKILPTPLLSMEVILSDSGNESSFQVALRHMKRLKLAGRLLHYFRFLYQLGYPG